MNKQNSAPEFKVKSVAEFIAALKAMRIEAAGGSHYLYRGLANAVWEILSSAELRLDQEKQDLPVKQSGNLMLLHEEMKTVFLDNSFLSMLTARLPIEPHNLQSYRDCLFWWDNLRHKYDLYVSDEVIREISDGTILGQVKKRLALVEDMKVLQSNVKVDKFARELVKEGALNKKSLADAMHIAICCVKGMDYLLTRNMKDMANADCIRILNRLAKKHGYKPPKILTPGEFIMLYNRGEL